MRNPLLKRIPREFIGEFGKYLAIFLFMTATIGFISGFLVSARSMKITYDESFERYNVENGHFVLLEEANEDFINRVEEENVQIIKDYYKEISVDQDGDGEKNYSLRLFGPRENVNQICLLEGKLPEQKNEIALDRLFLQNNKIEMGETIEIDGITYDICGMVAFSDYSTGYQSNNDIMFDATMFGVGVLTQEDFDAITEDYLHYSYAWKYKEEPEDDKEEKEVSEDLMVATAKAAIREGLTLDIFLPRYANKSIQFAGDDITKDKPMMTVLLYVLIAIMAFVFAVTVSNTIANEATVIGTLRASGYTKGEIFRHYIATPLLVTILAAIIGNILGYTIFVDVAKDMYLGSYNLTTYVTYWNAEAFIKTTIVPTIIMAIVISIAIVRKLSFSPLQLIRKDTSKKKREKAVKLPHFPFFTRFRIRIILQNLSGYLTLFIGIIFANLILMFGLVMTPLLDNYGDQAVEYKPANYQYILKNMQEIDAKGAEKYCVTSLKMLDDYYDPEDISVYGIVENSQYYNIDLPEHGVVVTNDFAEKYGVEEGSIINLKEEFGDKIYAFEVKGIYTYPTSLAVYMTQKSYNEVFADEIEEQLDSANMMNKMLGEMTEHKNFSYYNGYFSNENLEGTYLRKDNIASVITEDDLTKLSRQMDISMGEMFGMVGVFAIVLFALLLYLLTKLILEKNTNAISMVKILGYENKEIASLYLMSSIWVVVISAILALFINTEFFKLIIVVFLKGYGGWFHLTIAPLLYVKMFLMMLGTYFVVAVTQFIKIKKIPMDEALKNRE